MFLGFVLELSYLSVLQCDQGTEDNPLIYVGCSSKRPSIIGQSVDLLQPRVHGLDGAEIAIN